jgi:hypothetical protein
VFGRGGRKREKKNKQNETHNEQKRTGFRYLDGIY